MYQNTIMKDYQNHHQRRFFKTTPNNLRNCKLATYVTLLILAYALGYLTSSSSSSSKLNRIHENEVILPPTTSTSTSTAITTANNNCPPSASSPILDKNNDHNQFGPACSNPIRPSQVRRTIIDAIYNGTSPYVDFPSPHIASLLRPKKVKGWGSYGAVFENLIKKTRPEIIIEVGSFLGASATHMAELTVKLGLKTQIICLDDFRGWPGFRDQTAVSIQNGDVLLLAQFMQNVMYLNASDIIMPLPFSTGGGLEALCQWGIYGDLIEVDAGHDFHSAWSDINMAHKLLSPGGVMFGHDYMLAADNKGVRRAVDLFAKIHGYKVYVDGQHWVLN